MDIQAPKGALHRARRCLLQAATTMGSLTFSLECAPSGKFLWDFGWTNYLGNLEKKVFQINKSPHCHTGPQAVTDTHHALLHHEFKTPHSFSLGLCWAGLVA